ncbi:MAG TPA: YfhO family protein [Acidobacteriota bacterium]|jgi:hypothetical protein
MKIRDCHALIACVVLAGLFFGDALIGDRTLLPAGFLYDREPWMSQYGGGTGQPRAQFDLLFEFYPWAHFYRESIHRGELPLWNPHTYLGTPFLANPVPGIFFPIHWLHLVMPLRYSFTLVIMTKLLAMLAGMYLLLRREKLGIEASLLGACVASLSMHTIFSLANPFTNVTVTFPWAILSVNHFVRNRTRSAYLGIATCTALIVVSGQPQSIIPAFLGMALYAVILSWRAPRILLHAVVPFTAGVLVSSPQWLTTWEYVQDSMAVLGPRIAKSGPPYLFSSFLPLIIPDFFGNLDKGTFWGYPGYPDLSFYSSAIALVLAPAAFRNIRDKPFLRFCLVLAICSVGIMLGLPGFEQLLNLPLLRFVGRKKFAFLFIFALAGVAAYGAENVLVAKNRGRRLAVIAACFALLVGIVSIIYYRESQTALGLTSQTLAKARHFSVFLVIGIAALFIRNAAFRSRCLLAAVVLDLAIISYPLNARGSARALYPVLPVTRTLGDSLPRIAAVSGIWPPESWMLYGLQSIGGYDVLTPRRLFWFMRAIDPRVGDAYPWFASLDTHKIHQQTLTRQAWDSVIAAHGTEITDFMRIGNWWYPNLEKISDPALFGLLNVQYWFSREAVAPPGYTLYRKEHGYSIYANKRAFRARVFWKWVESNETGALETLRHTDVTNVAVVEQQLPAHPSASHDARVLETVFSSKYHVYEVEVSAPAVFVEFERYYAGWRAYLDGRVAPLFPADYLFRGVYVPAGRHKLEFKYQPTSLYIGLIIALLGLLLSGIVLVLAKVRV